MQIIERAALQRGHARQLQAGGRAQRAAVRDARQIQQAGKRAGGQASGRGRRLVVIGRIKAKGWLHAHAHARAEPGS